MIWSAVINLLSLVLRIVRDDDKCSCHIVNNFLRRPFLKVVEFIFPLESPVALLTLYTNSQPSTEPLYLPRWTTVSLLDAFTLSGCNLSALPDLQTGIHPEAHQGAKLAYPLHTLSYIL